MVGTYKKTLELFEKYPKDLLWSAVEVCGCLWQLFVHAHLSGVQVN